MNRVVVVVLAVLISCAHSTSLQQQAVGERSSRRPAHQQPFQQQQSRGDKEGDEENYRGSAKAKTGREGPPRRRLLSTATTANSIAKQQQHETAGGEPKARAGAGIAERESRTPQAVAGERSKSKSTVLRTVNGERPSEAALEEADGRAAQIQGVETIDAGEDYEIMDGVVEPVEGGGAEEDKGIEEGEAEGFVVEARDDKPEGGDPGDSLDNDNASTSGFSNNIMVIVFCALAFVANGGFLVYVFWVM